VKKAKATAKNFQTALRVTFTQLEDENLEILLNWPNLSETEQNELLEKNIDGTEDSDENNNNDAAEEEEKQLQKRPRTRTRRGKKKAPIKEVKIKYGDNVKVLDFGQIEGADEWWKRKIE
jgi:hypothetical protein